MTTTQIPGQASAANMTTTNIGGTMYPTVLPAGWTSTPSLNRMPFATSWLGSMWSNLQSYQADTGTFIQSKGKQGAAYVFMGRSDTAEPEKLGAQGAGLDVNNPGGLRGAKVRQLPEVMATFQGASNSTKQQMAKLLAMAGRLNVAYAQSPTQIAQEATMADVETAYQGLLQDAATAFSAGKNVTPTQLLQNEIRYNLSARGLDATGSFTKANISKWMTALGAPTTTSAAEKRANTSVSETHRSVDIFNADDAKNLIRTTLQNELGRDPTQGEYEDFIGALNTQSRAHPTVTTDTTHYGDQGQVASTDSTTHGGFDSGAASQFAYEQARENPDYSTWQAVGTYFPALLAAMGSAVPGT